MAWLVAAAVAVGWCLIATIVALAIGSAFRAGWTGRMQGAAYAAARRSPDAKPVSVSVMRR